GGAAVGDDEHAGGLGGALEPGEDLRFDLGVDGAGGVVEDEQAGVAGEGAGEGDPLALAAGEAGAALAEFGVQAVLEVADELVGPGGGQSLPDAGVVDALAVERDVGADGVVEDEGNLLDQRGGGGEGGGGEFAQVDAVEPDRAPGGVDEPGGQVGQGRLARAGGADERDGLAGFDGEGHVAQRLGAVRVGVGHRVEFEAGGAGALEFALAVGHVAGGGQDAVDAAAADHGGGEVAEDPADGADGEGQD